MKEEEHMPEEPLSRFSIVAFTEEDANTTPELAIEALETNSNVTEPSLKSTASVLPITYS